MIYETAYWLALRVHAPNERIRRARARRFAKAASRFAETRSPLIISLLINAALIGFMSLIIIRHDGGNGHDVMDSTLENGFVNSGTSGSGPPSSAKSFAPDTSLATVTAALHPTISAPEFLTTLAPSTFDFSVSLRDVRTTCNTVSPDKMSGTPSGVPRPVTGSSPGGETGVPVLSLLPAVAAGDPDYKNLLAAAHAAASNGKWGHFHDDLKSALVALGSAGSSIGQLERIERMLEMRTPATVLAYERFIRSVGEDVLDEFSADRDHRPFIEWLFEHPAILKAFADTIQPQDKPLKALQLWWEIWVSDEEGRERFANLAIACALVFDEPVEIDPAIFGVSTNPAEIHWKPVEKEVNGFRRYQFFRHSALRVPITEMTPRDLVWVVDAPVPESELIWAQQHLSLSRGNWSQAYGMIRYRMDRAVGTKKGANLYQAYTLAEILLKGGVCGDQAYFAAMTAKANGIPAMVISGEGDRGGHAWFGYKSGRNEWNLTTGRYADNYAAGETTDPQTRLRLKEHELKIYANAARRTDAYAKSQQLAALAKIFGEANRADLAALTNEDALQFATNLDAWFEKLAAMRAANIGVEDWKYQVARMRTAFHNYSDIVQDINKMEIDYIVSRGDYDAARKTARSDARRMDVQDKERTDLILDSFFREADLAEKSGKPDEIPRIYHDAMREKGSEMVGFKRIAERYYEWGKINNQGEVTVRDIITTFNLKHKEPPVDFFEIEAYCAALQQLISMATEQGMASQAHLLELRATKWKRVLEGIKKSMGP